MSSSLPAALNIPADAASLRKRAEIYRSGIDRLQRPDQRELLAFAAESLESAARALELLQWSKDHFEQGL